MWLAADSGANEALVQVAIWGAIGTIGAAAVTGLLMLAKALLDRARGSSPAPVTSSQPDTTVLMQIGALTEQNRNQTEAINKLGQSEHIQDIELRAQRADIDDQARQIQQLRRWAQRHDPDFSP